MKTEFEPSFKLCESITDVPEVHEAYVAFSDDPTQDQATILASVIIKSYVEKVASRENYSGHILNSRWVTCGDIEIEESGEFKGYMAEGIYSSVIMPLLKGEG